jgi:2-polyprenyl-3-methyl-5-hydroxy-6-metoxy-1,4-benzoquinol methylase
MIRSLTRKDEPELMDLPCLDEGELYQALTNLKRLNRFFGGTSLILHHLGRLIERHHPAGRISILDVGTGGADIPRAIVRWAQKRGMQVEVVAVDRHDQVLQAAATMCRDFPQIRLKHEDALALPYPPASFDFALSSLTLHHLSFEEAVILLMKLDELSRYAFIISDLVRSRLAYWMVLVVTRLLTRNRLTRYDGPLSVLRAFTLEELEGLARAASLPGLKLYRHPFFRVAAVCEKGKG